jgi:hypothetical protein
MFLKILASKIGVKMYQVASESTPSLEMKERIVKEAPAVTLFQADQKRVFSCSTPDDPELA